MKLTDRYIQKAKSFILEWPSIKLRIGRTLTEFSIVKPILILATIFLFHAFYDRIIQFVENHLLIPHDFSNYLLDLVLLICSIGISIFFGIKFWYSKYQPGISSKIIITIIFYVCFYLFLQSDELGWEFHHDSIIRIPYICYLLTPAFLFIIFSLAQFVRSKFSSKPEPSSFYSYDEPIVKMDNDSLGYNPYVENLKEIITQHSFPHSFCVALVGPWGNGKSSILELTEGHLRKNEVILRSNLFIRFLPYLNHNENDIINEFFILLSNKLSYYDGKVSNEILNYAQKITDLYHSKNLMDFIVKPPSDSKNQAAKELYDNINNSLERINKKIIVFIDDLDRLSGNEIIQVLKLIRNTANFKNTIFVVAMDKDYVLQRLKSSQQILNSSYLEKFFQLEIYLPQIDNSILRDSFCNAFDNYKNTSESNLSLTIQKAISHPDILFDDYVKNLRDVKRYTNQIKFDYPFIKNEINLVDFINFTFLKTRFPNVINTLYKDRSNLLSYKNDFYYMEKDDSQNNQNSENDLLEGVIEALSSRRGKIMTKDLEKFKGYKIFNNFIDDQKCKDNNYNIDCQDLFLLFKTLYTLFGNGELKNLKADSIQLGDNMNLILSQRILPDFFTKKDFNQLIGFKDLEDLQYIVSELTSNNKLPQFFKKLQWFEPENQNNRKLIIQILLYLYNIKKDLKVNRYDIDTQLDIYFSQLLNEKNGEAEASSEWLWTQIFESEFLDIDSQIFILGDLWESKNNTNLWKFSTDIVSQKAIGLYELKLSKIPATLWEVENFDFYAYYHALKNIEGTKKKLNDLFIKFWKSKEIELLCAQTIDLPAFTYTYFRISDVLYELFGSKNNYYDFVKEHSSIQNEKIKEYFEFLTLLHKTHYKIAINFKFEKSELIKTRIKNLVNAYRERTNYDEGERFFKIIFESNDKDLIAKLNVNRELSSKYHSQIFNNDDNAVAVVNFNRKFVKTELLELAILINEIGAKSNEWKPNELNEKKLGNNESFLTPKNKSDYYIKVIHPKSVGV